MSNDLKFYDRQKLEYWLRTKQSLRAIAKIMKRDHSVLVRELERNSTGDRKKYRADVAQRLSKKRRFKQHKGKLDKYPELKERVIEGLKREWSPDVIAGKLKTERARHTISHESIYHYIYNKDGRYENLYQYLRQGQAKRHKLHSRKKCKLGIAERKSIHLRPEYIDQRKRYGDWESDSMIFSRQKTILSVQSERKSKLIRLHKAIDKSAEETKNALVKTAESLPPEMFLTVTFDNGTEGARHAELKREYRIETYFCDPFASWQKGGVENANKLIIYYLPRSADLTKLTDRDIYLIQEKLNNRPRKCLNYKSSNEIINEVVH
ncbi:MAG: IS30 family transposase [Patescibacteria group bacterium]